MDSILHQLYSGDYDITPKRDKTQQELYEKRGKELEKVQAAFGMDFMNRLFDLEAACEEQESYQYYRAGFLTGARLMLEVLEG